MIQISNPNGAEFRLEHNATRLVFQCSAHIGTGSDPATNRYSPWQEVGEGDWEAQHQPSGVRQRVTIRRDDRRAFAVISHALVNPGPAEVMVQTLRSVTGRVELAGTPPVLGYLHALNARHGLNPLAELQPNLASIQLGRVTYPFFEGLALWQGDGRPCLVTGALTQNIVHRAQRLTWDGAGTVKLQTEQEFRGLIGKTIPAGGTLELDSVFFQFREAFEANTVFEDYLPAMREANGTRWESNPLRREHFHAPWNNYRYWEATAADIVRTASDLRRDFTGSVQWMGVDDGYQKAWVAPKLPVRPDGGLEWSWDIEMIWGNNCPGVTFGFPDGGLGEDATKYPRGLLALANEVETLMMKPMLWLGIYISVHHPLYRRHPEWFLPMGAGSNCLLDVSVPAVREQIEHVFRTYYGTGRWQAVKLDFWSKLFERPDIIYRQGNQTAAEWRRWFFEMVRRYVPDHGFISLGCDLAMGAPWVAPWVDSYRFSNDMRDGSWANVRSNIRWSVVPLLTHGFGQPIGDCDSVSIFKDLSLSERTCWADYSHQIGSMVEIGGDPAHWSEADKQWLRGYLDEPRGGERCWIGDAEAWRRDGLPRVVSRWRAASANTPAQLITSLHNWSDEELTLVAGDWCGPVSSHRTHENLRTSERGELTRTTSFRLPPRSSCLLRTK